MLGLLVKFLNKNGTSGTIELKVLTVSGVLTDKYLLIAADDIGIAVQSSPGGDVLMYPWHRVASVKAAA